MSVLCCFTMFCQCCSLVMFCLFFVSARCFVCYFVPSLCSLCFVCSSVLSQCSVCSLFPPKCFVCSLFTIFYETLQLAHPSLFVAYMYIKTNKKKLLNVLSACCSLTIFCLCFVPLKCFVCSLFPQCFCLFFVASQCFVCSLLLLDVLSLLHSPAICPFFVPFDVFPIVLFSPHLIST